MSLKALQQPERFVDILTSQEKIALRNNTNSTRLLISESNGSIKIEKSIQDYSNYADQRKQVPIYAVYGIIPLLKQTYLIVCTEAEVVGNIAEHIIWRAKRFEFITVNGHSIDPQDIPFKKMLLAWLNIGYFYFSYTYDLTNTVDKNLSNEHFGAIGHEVPRHNSRYFYNEC